MTRVLTIAAMLLSLSLGGCAGGVLTDLGLTRAGGGAAASKHVDAALSKSGCPDFAAQGAAQATGLTASCTDSPSFGHTETFKVDSFDPNQALATAFNAQVQQTNQIMAMIGPVLQAIAPFLVTAASGGVIPPIPKPIQPQPPAVTVDSCALVGKTLIITSTGATCG